MAMVEQSRALPSSGIRCIQELIEDQLERAPDSVAVVFEGRHMTGRELRRRSNQLAHYLRRHGVGPETYVGVCIGRCLELPLVLLGILKAGGAYVPLDPSHPSARLSFMLEDASPALVITQAALRDRIPAGDRDVLAIDEDWERIAAESEVASGVTVPLDAPCYAIYTSGTTGRPKAVVIEHRSLLNYVEAIVNELYLSGLSQALVQPLSVDAAGTTIYSALLTGGSLHVISEECSLSPVGFGDYLRENAIDCLKLAPSHYLALSAGTPRPPLPRQRLLFGGEMFPTALARQVLEAGPGCEIYNHYGPTETTVGVTVHKLEPADLHGGPSIPIGRPLPGVTAVVLDERMEPVPSGVPGELLIGGPFLAREYLHQPELTARSFVPDPLSENGGRLYRTGDRVRLRPDGNLVYLGRTDTQVKVRGFRIELSEVEAALTDHPAVTGAAVTARISETGEARLAAHVVLRPDQLATTEELTRHLQQTLPRVMTPSAYDFLENLPLTPHGKIDRQVLARRPLDASPQNGHAVAPRTRLERDLAAIWERLLDHRPVGVTDSFFDLGGHSLLAVRMFAEIESELHVSLPLATLLEAPTIEALAARISDDRRQTTSPVLVPIQPEGSAPPLFCIHGNAGNVLFYRDLAAALGREQPLYGLQSAGLDGESFPLGSVEEMAALYSEQIRAVYPSGPYLLAAYCLGAYVAIEMAHALRSSGGEVPLIVIFNTDGAWRTVRSSADGLRYHARNLSRLGLRSKWRYLARRLRYRLGFLRTRLVARIGLLFQHSSRPMPTGIRRHYVRAVNIRASLDYRPKHFRGKMLYFRGAGDRHCDPGPFWSSVIEGPIEIVDVPGREIGILAEPNVQAVAEALQAALAEGTARNNT